MKKKLSVLLALMLVIALVFTGCKKEDKLAGTVEDNPADVVVDNDNNNNGIGSVKSDIQIEEGESIVEKHVAKDVQTFLTGHYTLKGTIYSADTATPWTIATDGKNYHVTTSSQGLSFGVLIIDDVTYLVQPSAKTYTELTDMLLKTLGLEEDFDISELTNFNVEDIDNTISKINQSAVTINGQEGVCNEYFYDEISAKLYSIGDKLIQIDNYDADGALTMQIVVDEISPDIAPDTLTLNGLEKASITSFISSIMKSAAK